MPMTSNGDCARNRSSGIGDVLAQSLFELAPMTAALDLTLVDVRAGEATVTLGVRGASTGRGMIGGGTMIAALAEAAAVAAAWSAADLQRSGGGYIVSIELDTLTDRPARTAEAVAREANGDNVWLAGVLVSDDAGEPVATARVTYAFRPPAEARGQRPDPA